jgi:hypothetical protein
MDKEFLLQDDESIGPGKKEPNWEQGFNNVCVWRVEIEMLYKKACSNTCTP